ncbi:unnamed protein product [Closterium sp. NIES-65]|nr:unnamed protein product [Closterium sp. NIES-65]
MMRRMGTASEWFPPPGDANEQFWQGANGDAAGAGNGNGAADEEQEGAAGSGGPYTGYVPNPTGTNHQLPVIVQFHEGAFVTGSKDSACNDTFCRRLARVCNAIVVAVGYRLAPEHKCPAAYDDGYEVLKWLSRQAILADAEADGGEVGAGDEMRGLTTRLVQELPDPWLAAHADVHRCILLGVSAGANVADQVARRCVTPHGVNELQPLVVLGQVLLYPLFAGSMPTPSEMKARDAYFFDKPTCELVFRLFLPDDDFSLDHPAVNPLLREHLPPGMPPTLLVVADHDILTDRAIAYSVFLKNFGIDVQVNSYKDVVHGFATYEGMVNTPQAEACAEDIAMALSRVTQPGGPEKRLARRRSWFQLTGNFYRLIGASASVSTPTVTRLPLARPSPPAKVRFMDTGASPPATVTAADIGDADRLQEWLEARLPGGKAVLERWGSERGTKRVANLWQELVDGEVCLVDSRPPLRKVSVASVHVRHARTGKVLLEAMQEMGDGTVRARNRPLSEKMRPAENPLDACRRGILEELGEDLGASHRVSVLADTLRRQVEERESFSYPGLRSQYEIHVVEAVVEGLPEASFCTVENEGQAKSSSKVHRCAAVSGEGPCMWAGSDSGEPRPRPCGRGAGAGAGGVSKGAAGQGVNGGVCFSEGEGLGSGSDGEQRALGVKRHFWVWTDTR